MINVLLAFNILTAAQIAGVDLTQVEIRKEKPYNHRSYVYYKILHGVETRQMKLIVGLVNSTANTVKRYLHRDFLEPFLQSNGNIEAFYKALAVQTETDNDFLTNLQLLGVRN